MSSETKFGDINLDSIFAKTADNRSKLNNSNSEYIDFKINEDGVELVKRTINTNSTLKKPLPDTIVKEVWGIKDGKLVQLDEIVGVHTPAHLVEEKIEFPE